MKIDRLISILSVLLQKDKVTAAQLAQKFEVSRRTILRDIEDLNRAGIPIVTVQGTNGGISIMENYKTDKTLLSCSEMQAIITGLQGLDSVSGTSKYRQLMDKLSVETSTALNADNHIIIDLSMWDKSDIASKIELIKQAIEQKQIISFCYYSPKGKTVRKIEPYHLVFQWSSWYVWGYCIKRRDFRMFKLNRLNKLKNTGEKRGERVIPPYTCDKLRHTRGSAEAIVKFDKSVKWRLIDEWGTNNFEEDRSGNIIIKFTWSDKHSLFNWLLTFADCAEIVSPEDYRREFSEIVRKTLNKYDI